MFERVLCKHERDNLRDPSLSDYPEKEKTHTNFTTGPRNVFYGSSVICRPPVYVLDVASRPVDGLDP